MLNEMLLLKIFLKRRTPTPHYLVKAFLAELLLLTNTSNDFAIQSKKLVNINNFYST